MNGLIFISVLAVLLISKESLGQENWGKKSELVKGQTGTVYTSRALCEDENKEECLSIPEDYHPGTHAVKDLLGTDLDNPVWAQRQDHALCSGEDECTQALLTPCTDPEMTRYVDEAFSETWCTQILRYPEIKIGEEVALDDTKTLLHLQKLADEEALGEKVAKAHGDMAMGREILAKSKALLGSAWASIGGNENVRDMAHYLLAGELCLAKEAMGKIDSAHGDLIRSLFPEDC